MRLQDRRRRLLRLEDERVVLVAALEDDDEAARPDAADADHLEGEVDEAVPLEEVAPVLGHRRPVVGEDLLQRRRAAGHLDVGDDGRVVEDDPAPVDDPGERLEGAHAVAPAGLA